jgi:hypothetical protein
MHTLLFVSELSILRDNTIGDTGVEVPDNCWTFRFNPNDAAGVSLYLAIGQHLIRSDYFNVSRAIYQLLGWDTSKITENSGFKNPFLDGRIPNDKLPATGFVLTGQSGIGKTFLQIMYGL